MQRLEREGLSRQQAEGVVDALEEVIEESIRSMQVNLVTRAEQDKVSTSLHYRASPLLILSLIASLHATGELLAPLPPR